MNGSGPGRAAHSTAAGVVAVKIPVEHSVQPGRRDATGLQCCQPLPIGTLPPASTGIGW